MRTPAFIELTRPDADALRDELIAGLGAPQPAIAPKFLYDALGSRLFEAITELPEYYPTRTERAIFHDHAAEIARSVGHGATFIDLGAGNCEKAARLFESLQPQRYVAVDISVDFVRQALALLQQRYPDLPMAGVGVDFSAALRLPPEVLVPRCVFFYPGSSIGNFNPRDAVTFLRQMRACCGDDGGLLIGVDLVKARELVEPAYDDALGVTAAFNLNLLLNVNRLLGTDFNTADWRHVGLWNETESRIEMHLEARHNVALRWDGGGRRFAAGDRIHTENSYKYRCDDFEVILRDAGFARTRRWTDERGWFAVIWASV